MATPSTVEIAPRGDVVLICGKGDEVIKLRVESKTLSLASPVFKALLESKFKEAAQLAATGHVDIPLPDDNPYAMSTFCRTIHMAGNIIEVKQSVSDILEVAVLADKYDCCAALSFASYYWINEKIESVGDLDRGRLFLAAYLLKQEKTFAKLSYDMVMKNSTNVQVVFNGEYCPQELQDAVEFLERQRLVLARELARTVEWQIFMECTGKPDESLYAGHCLAQCTYLWTRGVAFMETLKTTGIWPLSEVTTRPLSKSCDALKTFFANFSHRVPTCIGRQGKNCKGFNLQSLPSLKESFSNQAKRVEQKAPRLCIKCVQQGNSQAQGECQKDHSA